MKTIKIETADGIAVAQHVRVARNFLNRAVGLMGRKELTDQEGMLFMPGGSIHTIGMRVAIDVAFLDASYRVLKTSERLRPFRTSLAPRGTRYTLELAPGRLNQIGIATGAQLRSADI